MSSRQAFNSDDSQQSTSQTDFMIDVKPDVTLLGQTVPGLLAVDSDDLHDRELSRCSLPTPECEPTGKKSEKKQKKGSKKMAIKGVKQSASGSDDSFTMGMLSAGRGQCKVQPGHLTPSLLEEVLNDKKRALLRSPEVLQTLQLLQSTVQDKREKQIEEASSKASIQSTPQNKSSSQQSHKDTPPSGSSSSKSPASAKHNQSIWSKEGSAFTSVTSSST